MNDTASSLEDRTGSGRPVATAGRRPAAVLKSLELPGRVRLQYAERGDPSGIPLVLLHGYTDSWRSFELVLPHLPPSIHAFALSQRGHGDSERPPTGYSPSDLAGDLAAFLDALGLERAVVAGHSMGSHIAQRFALDHPGRALGIALLGSFFRFEGNAPAAELVAAVAGLTDPVDPGFAREFQQSTLARPIPPDYLAAVVQESLKLPARVWQAVLAGLVAGEHADQLPRIDLPTLILWGDADAFCPRSDQDAFTAAIAGSRLLVHLGGGHAFHWEDPALCAAELATFAERVATRR